MPASTAIAPPVPASVSVLGRDLRTVTSSLSLLATNDFILCDCTAGGFSLTLPLASSMARRTMTFKKIDTTSNMVTLLAQGADKVDGGPSRVLTGATMPSVTLFSTGSTWYIQ